MKKIYFLFAGLFTAAMVNAQLTQANHAPTVGDTYQMFQCDSTLINSGASGAGAVWNFSAVATRSSISKTFTTAAAGGAYTNAAVALGSGSANVSYYNSDASSLKFYGGTLTIGGVAAALVYTTPAIQAAYPMALNTTTNNSIGGTISALGLPGTFLGTSSVKADGTGTLILPGANATFTNATRVVTSQTLNFTGIASGVVTQINYDYYVTGIKAPAFSISSSTFNVTSPLPNNTSQVTVFRNKDAVLSSTTTVGLKDSKLIDKAVSIYPNPCNTTLNFLLPVLNNAKLQIVDLTGKTIDVIEISGDKLSLPMSNYNNGLYFYKIIGSEGQNIQTGKFTVTH